MQSKEILRIIKISEKYNQRPSEILDINNTHLAFCFDEAVEYILSHRYFADKKEGNMVYKVIKWTKKPRWIDEEEVSSDDFLANMEANLEKQKKLRGIVE